MEEDEEEHLQLAAENVKVLSRIGIKLICIDFDDTLLGIHTGGKWQQSAVELCAHVRPFFLSFIRVAYEAGICVSIVSFSPQVDLIRQVLEITFGDALASHLIVRCDDPSWKVETVALNEFVSLLYARSPLLIDRKCKLPYVISASTEASRWSENTLQNMHTLLIDDDPHNVKIANDHGILSIYFDPESDNMRTISRRIQKLSPSPPPCVNLAKTPLKKRKLPACTPDRPARLPPPSTSAQVTPSRRDATPAAPPRKAKSCFNLCTPSPVMKLKYTVDMGRPKSKRMAKSMRRNIHEDLDENNSSSQGTSLLF